MCKIDVPSLHKHCHFGSRVCVARSSTNIREVASGKQPGASASAWECSADNDHSWPDHSWPIPLLAHTTLGPYHVWPSPSPKNVSLREARGDLPQCRPTTCPRTPNGHISGPRRSDTTEIQGPPREGRMKENCGGRGRNKKSEILGPPLAPTGRDSSHKNTSLQTCTFQGPSNTTKIPRRSPTLREGPPFGHWVVFFFSGER